VTHTPDPPFWAVGGHPAPIVDAAQICHFWCWFGFASSSARGWLESGVEEHNAV
jgi:hypothetical protein